MRSLSAFTSIVCVLVVAGAGNADHCVTYSTSSPEIDTTPIDCPFYTGEEPCHGAIYVDNDPCQLECLFSVWIYGENNGIPGLQRGDEVKDDTCHGMIQSDVPPINF